MDSSRIIIVVLLIIFLLVSPDGQSTSPSQQQDLQVLLGNEHVALQVLGRTSAGDFDPLQHRWLNISGFRPHDGFAWDLLPKATARSRAQADLLLRDGRVQTDKHSVEHVKAVSAFGQRYTSSKSLDDIAALPEDSSITPVVPFYQNVTGRVDGQWMRSFVGGDKPRLQPNASLLLSLPYKKHEWTRNITGDGGKLTLLLDVRKSQSMQLDGVTAREIKVKATIEDARTQGDGWEVTLHGVHYIEAGHVLLTTTSDKFAGIFALPHFVRSSSLYPITQRLLNGTLQQVVAEQERADVLPAFPWSSSTHASEARPLAPQCELLIWLQQHLVWPYRGQRSWTGVEQQTSHLDALEQELRFPSGAPTNLVPDLKFSAVILSPDCGFVLESKAGPGSSDDDHLHGVKAEVFYARVRRLIELLALLATAQIFLLIRQIKDASTPSPRSRISYSTVAMMALGDGFGFLTLMALSLFIEILYLPLIATAFLAFLGVSFFGMKFLIDLWTVQAPERIERERERERRRLARLSERSTAASTSPTQDEPTRVAPLESPGRRPTTTEQAGLPLPVTAERRQDPILITPDQEVEVAAAEDAALVGPGTPATGNTPRPAPTTGGSARREMGALYSRFYLLLLSIVFLSLNATTWPSTLRLTYTYLLSACYLSFWIPQIKRNILRNCRKALRWEFVLGQSMLRLAPFMYLFAYEDNILMSEPNYTAFLCLLAWVWLQVLLLISQDVLGPRFFVPEGWAPPAYDYHPVLREGDEEAGARMPLGFVQSPASSADFTTGPGRGTKSPPYGEDADNSRPTGETSNLPHRSNSLPAPGLPSPGLRTAHGTKTFDCAICMQTVEVPVVARGARDGGSLSASGLFGRRAYMVTPCRHLFHSPCLEGWMRYKLQCPICRESLPPL